MIGKTIGILEDWYNYGEGYFRFFIVSDHYIIYDGIGKTINSE